MITRTMLGSFLVPSLTVFSYYSIAFNRIEKSSSLVQLVELTISKGLLGFSLYSPFVNSTKRFWIQFLVSFSL